VREKATFDAILTTATVELFASSGVTIAPSPNAPTLDRVAVIGFGGGGLRGSLGLGVSNEVLEKLALPGREPGARLHDDWLAEMSNQLLGRVKNRLLRRGVTIAIALPMVLRGLRVEIVGAGKELWSYPFDSSEGSICVWLDVLADPEFTLASSDEGHDIPSEGELILF
jgi:CheY-specific phosphatase CheX